MVVWRCWNLLFANNDTSWRKNYLILFLYIWFAKLLLSKWWMISSGLNLWNHGRLPKRWYFFTKNPNSFLVHANIWCPLHVFSFDVGDMSKEQRQLRQCKFLHTTRSCSFDVTIENLVSWQSWCAVHLLCYCLA